MQAVGYKVPLPAQDPNALLDVELPDPVAGERDLLVEVRAISVNPVDTKVRRSTAPPEGQIKVLGWDASGIVRAVGSGVSLFKPGDAVWYAGSIARAGTNSALHTVDERIVGYKPVSLDFAQAAALPLTAITAWELLFDRLQVALDTTDRGETLLIVGAAGGVGSILTQLARQLTGITIIGTASRPETQKWVQDLGAHQVIDHSRPLAEQLQQLGIAQVSHVASLTRTDLHYGQLVEVLAPQGRLGLIDDPGALDVSLLKRKSLSLHWELMFTRPLFETPDMIEQHHLLNRVGELVDAGVLRTTLGDHFGRICAENLRKAHALIESAKARGKIVLEGF
ncbi:zinc-binding alcohol dehydrogenase family protein [Gloeobacter morelensis]|uniref:Zinc-type alcohol dehydrogenase-like protein n=1 Tax=Gloeobacter morelensis MG652769 TaxID=2781736 RepID=A0ABY3PIQ8_9CYAN|nr:zinc-binding alcohol dehydrogenase family protein [Gloeobacter morelensis]UFP93516.1 zinc-binding alcohol dehydrogenase family protein [Gloeobacter morelensis MG652769]